MSDPDNPFRQPVGFFAGFVTATAFLTRVPTSSSSRQAWQLADSAWAFPLVGAGIGVAAGLTFLLAQSIGLDDWPAALLAVLSSIALTGALHEDGLADTADGFFGGHDREAKLAIMRDSRHGTFGVLAIGLSVLLRAAVLAALGDVIHAGLALIAAHAVSRAALPVAMWSLAAARTEGFGAAAGTPRPLSAIGAAAIGILIALATLGPSRGVVALALTGVAVWVAAGLARRQIGGYTGDVLGALQQVGEIVMLLAVSAR
jgi:adenosylcobinamide-GDP ribazoletransferase